MTFICWNKLAFTEFLTGSPGWPLGAYTAGLIAAIIPIWPGTGFPSIAALTAPQFSCPNTIKIFEPNTKVPYSILPIYSGVAIFLASLTTNKSPKPLSKSISTGTRESAQ